MKKLFLIVAVAFFAFGCEGPQGIPGPQGRPGVINKFTLEFTIKSQDWVRLNDNAGNFIGWNYVVDMPELTRDIYERGLYATYLWESSIQEPLPIIVYNETDNQLWEKKISCDYAVGSVAMYYQENDFQNENVKPATMTFRIQLMS